MHIPKGFTLHGCPITVEVVNSLEDNNYGEFVDAKELIKVARTVKVDKETVQLSQTQVENTFWHEVFHAFQWHVKGEYDETEATSYAGLMVELIRSGQIRINPNEIIADKPKVYDND